MNLFLRRCSLLILTLLGAIFYPDSTRADLLPKEPLGPSSRRTGMVISEIHYHPADRTNTLNTEFIEFYNSNPFIEDLSGWRISGDVNYTFPSNTVLKGNSFLVVAPNPVDVQSVYGITNVLGGWTGGIPNKGGRLQVSKRSGGIVLDLTFSDSAPWPVLADGWGPSLVLSRPTYGEADPRAWSHSQKAGGSPGQPEPASVDPLDSILINEVLLTSASSRDGFVEFYNPTTVELNLAGCQIAAASSTNRFIIPSGTVISPGGVVCFETSALGFLLRPQGDTLWLLNPTGDHAYDAVSVEGQVVGKSAGRYPDGNGPFRSLRSPTPCARNGDVSIGGVVINEIMFKPPIDHPGLEFVELYNWTSAATNISGWRFTSGIDFLFPANVVIPAGGYVVVAKNPEALRAAHGSFPPGVLWGPYAGNLASSGERLALARPETVVDAQGTVSFWAVVDEVNYSAGGRWGKWTDGGGSSLELLHPNSDHQQPSSWANSDESGKSSWLNLERTQILTAFHPSVSAADQLQVMLFGAGETLLDDVAVLVNGQNRLKNSNFETNLANWVGQGTHRGTSYETNRGFESSRSIRITASDRGDQVANRVRTPVSPAISLNTSTTLRARARWQRGEPDLLLRLRGGGMELPVRLPIPANLGTPGRPNSRTLENVGPAVADVRHFPVFPATNQPIRVTARVTDPDGVASVTLKYRFDPAQVINLAPMVDDGTSGDEIAGDQVYTAMIPGRPRGSLVAFRVEASDKALLSVTNQFPEAAPLRECLVRVGEPIPKSGFGTYHLWLTSSNHNYWAAREKMSNEEVDATFIYGTNRIVYNAGARYAGSYYTVGIYDTPTGALCGYDIVMPGDQTLLGEDHFTLDWPIRDSTDQREQLMFWMCEQLGLPNLYRRYVNLYVNGTKRGDIYDDIQQPDGTTVGEFFPADHDGMLVKTDCWDEFADNGDPYGGLNCVLNTMEDFRTIEGDRNLSRYRWNWRPRAVKGSAHDFTPFLELVDAINSPTPGGFLSGVSTVVDMEQWMRTFAMNDLASYWDGFGNPNSKNTYLYKPQNSGWKLMSWDFDVGLGVFGDPVDAPLFDNVGDPGINRIYATPAFLRPYWETLQESVNSFFVATNGSAIDALLSSKYAAFKTNGVALADPADIKSWIAQRRTFLLGQLKRVATPFAVTTPSASVVTNSSNVITLSGTAPADLVTIRVNGEPQSLRWTTVTNWAISLVLTQGENPLLVEGLNRKGNLVTNGSKTLQVYSTAPSDPEQQDLRLSEVLLHPLTPGSCFIEIQNRSASTARDIGGWELEGLGLTFPKPTVIPPGGSVAVVGDRVAFAEVYGWDISVAGVLHRDDLPDPLDLALVKPESGISSRQVIDRLYVATGSPWPLESSQVGVSLQRIDLQQEALRPAAWGASSGIVSTSAIPLLDFASRWRYNDSGANLGQTWYLESFDDSAWLDGLPVFFNTPDSLTVPKTTLIQLTNSANGSRILTHYFRNSFVLDTNPGLSWLRISMAVDDGVAFYLNGQEILRRRLPSGVLTPSRLATNRVAKAVIEPLISIPVTNLRAGTNRIAAEVHQAATNDTDVVFGASVSFLPNPLSTANPAALNALSRTIPPFPTVWLTEIAPASIPGVKDSYGETDPWLEIYNAGTQAIALDSLVLWEGTSRYLTWPFPAGASLAPGEYRLVWLDGQASQTISTEWHASLRVPATSGVVILGEKSDGSIRVLDSLAYASPEAGESFGKYPSNSPSHPRTFAYPTPGAVNNPLSKPAVVRINEWMASNTHTLSDPADGHFDDWLELYNPGNEAVDLTGFSLTDNPAVPTLSVIPPGFVIPAGGYLLVWADEQPSQTVSGESLHANFKLSASGEQILLFDRDGRLVDSVVFKKQSNDLSQGRYPDGSTNPFEFFTLATPGSANISDRVPETVQIQQVTRLQDGSVVLSWGSRPGSRYRVQYKKQIEDSSWTSLPDVILGAGGSASLRDVSAANEEVRFYRVELQP